MPRLARVWNCQCCWQTWKCDELQHLLILTPSGIYAFVILKDGVTDSDEEMAQSLKKLVRKKIGSFAVPQLVMVRDRK